MIGSCTCSEGMAGASRACTTTNAIGTCYGTETCDVVTGWSACTAPDATLETCDGVDNDCDFLIDEDVGGGEPCANTVTGVGSCPGTRTCMGASGFVCQGQIPMAEVCNYADDDCDSAADEAFPTLSTLCSPGIGACQRFGSMRCTMDGTGVECSVTAAMPTAERCNGLDDDCDNGTDETFTTLGDACSAGLGVCTRYGTTVCSGDGLSTACSATAGTSMSAETCNYLDDNCDGTVDDGFKNPVTGAYDSAANCGACGNNCDAVFTGPSSSGSCSTASGSPQCVMVCDAGAFDLNNSALDGCELVLDATSVYVSVSEADAIDDATCGLGPTGTGAGNHPCKTIAFGLSRAASLGRPNLRIADGTYDEPVALVSNRSLFGGYRPGTWERHLATTNTVIQGVTAMGAHDATVTAIGVTSAVLEGFVVRGSFNTKPSGNSYAIYISGGSASLAIRNNQIFAGRGGPGAAGPAGQNGTVGTNGGGSVAGSYDSFVATGTGTCNASNNRQLANGGARQCGANDVSGGNGGGNRCTPVINMKFSGIDGFAGNSGGGAGGGMGGATAPAGWDGELETNPSSICFVPPQSWLGTDGSSGQSGAHGAVVSGCSAPGGGIIAGHWRSGTAATGSAGSSGGGGSGGGGGGGARCTSCGGNGKDRLGAHGGGGGSGGCGGVGGGGGGAGGGVFGIFVLGGTAPAITNNTIQRGAGGTAGDGGIGGAGGPGGSGGAGGAAVTLCTGKGGRGGDGGAGGHGSGGGGGCGGSSFGIYTSGVGTPTYCSANTISGGSPGQGGSGGYSGGNSGGDGAAGTLQDCTSS